jgi:type 1 glutamine amidotransferase
MIARPVKHLLILPALIAIAGGTVLAQEQNIAPKGFTALFNGKDLSGWKGLVEDPIKRAKMTKEQLATAQKAADDNMRAHWSVKEGVLVFDGKGHSLCTAKDYADFELYCDWKIEKGGDSGLYLRGTPQVQIWDPGAAAINAVGSGGLFNNKKYPSKPLTVADKPIGEWNTFYIKMVGDRVSVTLNGKLVVDNTVLENYSNEKQPLDPVGQIELQAHGNPLYFRNIYIREITRGEFVNKIFEAIPTVAREKPKQARKVLVYTHAAGFVHSSIPYGAKAMEVMGRRTGAYDAVLSNNPAVFEPATLKEFDAIVLVNTTGDWLQAPGQKASAETITARRKAVEEFVSGGKGLVGFHAASDSQYNWAEFGKMIGGYFNQHPWTQKIGVRIEAPKHPLSAAFKDATKNDVFEVNDEMYQFKDPYSREHLRVLLSIDNSTIDTSKGIRPDKDYAVAWIHNYGKGRVFYSSLGHREEIYWNPTLLRFYLDGIQFAVGDLEADATPSKAAGGQ